MSLIEFQVSSSAFLAAQRNALRSQRICPPDIPKIGATQPVIDKVEFGSNVLRHNKPASFPIFYQDHGDLRSLNADGFLTQIAQNVTVFVTLMNDIMNHPNQPPTVIIKIPLVAIIDLDFYSLDEDCYLRMTLSSVEPGARPAIPPPLSRFINVDALIIMVQDALPKFVPSRTVPAGLSELTTLFAKFLNAGVSVDTGLQRIAFRAQIGGSSSYSDVPWSNFLKGFFGDRTGGTDWAFYIDSGLITEKVKAEVNVHLDDLNVDHLDTYVGCAYSNNSGTARFTLDVKAIYKLPDPVPNISRDPHLPVDLTVSGENTLKLVADYSEVMGLIHSFAVVEFFLPWLSTMAEGILQFMIGSALAESNKNSKAPFCKKVAETVIECVKYVQMPQLTNGTLSLMTQLATFDDGIALGGSMKSTELTPTVLSTAVGDFKWRPPKVSCGAVSLAIVAAFQDSPSSFAKLHAEGVLDNAGTTPIFYCDLTVLNDPLNVFDKKFIRVDEGPAAIHFLVDVPIPNPQYYQAGSRYPCDLLVKTTAGTRLLRLSPPPEITQADIDRLTAELLVKVGNCQQLISPWFKNHRGFNPAWSVDPPFDQRVNHLWQVEITGLEAGEMVTLLNSSRLQIAQGIAQAGIPLRMTTMMAPGGESELTVLRGGIESFEETGGTTDSNIEIDEYDGVRGIEVTQRLLIGLGSVPLGEEVQTVISASLRGRSVVAVVGKNGIRAFNLRSGNLQMMRSWSISGVRGALSWQGRILHYGSEGFGWIDSEGNHTGGYGDCCQETILDVAVLIGNLYAITNGALKVYSPRLCKLNETQLDGGKCIASTAGKLIVGSANGITVYDPADLTTPVSALTGIDVKRVIRPIGHESGTILAVLADDSARLLNVSGTEIEGIGSFPETPWNAKSVVVGDLLVGIGEDGRSLDVHQFGDSAVI